MHPEEAWVVPHIISPSLEVGCGSKKTIGIDVAVDRTAPGTHGSHGCELNSVCAADMQAEMDDLPFEDGKFNSVMSRHVLEHHADTLKVLTEWNRVLSIGGKVVVVVPDQKNYQGNTVHLDGSHEAAFTPMQLVKLLEHSGFSVSTVETVVPNWSFGIVAIKIRN
jgi:predicted SAM-dependent methyltransferase